VTPDPQEQIIFLLSLLIIISFSSLSKSNLLLNVIPSFESTSKFVNGILIDFGICPACNTGRGSGAVPFYLAFALASTIISLSLLLLIIDNI